MRFSAALDWITDIDVLAGEIQRELEFGVHAFEQGGLILSHAVHRLVLLDSEGIAVDVRQLRPDEKIQIGDRIDFPCFTAVVDVICITPIVPDIRIHLL
jgi:hypothetical protein